MATKPPVPKVHFTCAQGTLHASRDERAQKPLIMQNKANFQKAQMNASTVLTNDYDNWTLGERGKNKPKTNPKQSQTNPKQAQNESKRTQNKPNTKDIQIAELRSFVIPKGCLTAKN